MGRIIDRYLNSNVLFVLILVGIFIFPMISLSSKLPHFELTDLFVPLLIFRILKDNRFNLTIRMKQILIAVFLILSISLVINFKYNSYNDLFEYYKYIKIFLFVYFAKIYFFENKFLDKTIDFIFIILFLLNILQYFNLFNFNYLIEPLYADIKHLVYFGKNTLGEPDTKRLLGTFGNPNNNSLGISFFFFYYLFNKRKNKIKYLFVFLSLLLILASQSRTGFYAVTLIFVVFLFTNCKELRFKLFYVLLYLFSFFIINRFQDFEKIISTKKEESVLQVDHKQNNVIKLKQYKDVLNNKDVSGTKYLSSVDFEDMDQNTSINSRIKIWSELLKMIKNKPIFGHGPQKNFFYDRNLYPENEYILILWRFGILGLTAYIFVLFFPIYKSFRKFGWKLDYNLCFLILISITAITNLPLCEPRISILFAISYGFILKNLESDEKKIIVN